jgi:hypothetical protein
MSIDTYSENQQRVAVGSAGIPSYSRFDRSYKETNYDLLATADKKLSEDFNLRLWNEHKKKTRLALFSSTSGGLVIPNFYAISNSLGTVPAPISYQPKAVDGYFEERLLLIVIFNFGCHFKTRYIFDLTV